MNYGNLKNNVVSVHGEVYTMPEYSHEVYGEDFFESARRDTMTRIYQEDRSTDTRETLRYSKQIIEREGLDPQIALATNDYHAYRAEKYAEHFVELDGHRLCPIVKYYKVPKEIMDASEQRVLF